tara:strand:+ start:55 stop:249 length:195 start_codon:yes stop_codon:yes gene_type:complete
LNFTGANFLDRLHDGNQVRYALQRQAVSKQCKKLKARQLAQKYAIFIVQRTNFNIVIYKTPVAG